MGHMASQTPNNNIIIITTQILLLRYAPKFLSLTFSLALAPSHTHSFHSRDVKEKLETYQTSFSFSQIENEVQKIVFF